VGKPHYLPFYTGDYRRATPHLSAEEHGAYLMLMFTMFDAGGDLPYDENVLRRVSTVSTRRWPKVWKTLRPFFTIEGDRVFQKRTKSELLKCQIKSMTLAANGILGNEVKHAKALERGIANANANANADGNAKPYASHNQSQEREREWSGETSSRKGSEGTKTPAPPAGSSGHPASSPAATDALLDGMPVFGPAAFRVLFGQWPGQTNPKFNERPADAEAAFFKHITPDNYASFVHALNAQLVGFTNDPSSTRRKDLGTFRTFCEERWTKYKDPAPPPAPNPTSLLVSTVDDAPLMDV